jgi:hypothetical protein
MGGLPSRIDDRTLPGLDNAIAGAETGFPGGVDEIHVRPIVAVVVHVVRYLAK